MFTEHSVTYEIQGGTRVIRRELFTQDTRILGSEYTIERVYGGVRDAVNPWKVTESCTETRQFRHMLDAQAWMDEMFRAWDIAQATGAMERARTAWARVNDQLSLEL